MKTIAALFLLFSISLSYSQEEIENWSHPYQVLFVDSAFYIGENKPVKPFDFVEKYDLIKNHGQLVLVHFTGKVLMIEEKILNIREISEGYNTWEYVERPIFSNPELFKNNSLNYRNRLDGNSGTIICRPPEIELVYPRYDFSEKICVSHQQEQLAFAWYSPRKTSSFKIEMKNIYDEVLWESETSDPVIIAPYDSIKNQENLVIIKIISNEDETYFGQYGIHLNDQESEDEYQILINALTLYWLKRKEAAENVFMLAIQRSNQDPRFKKIFNDHIKPKPAWE